MVFVIIHGGYCRRVACVKTSLYVFGGITTLGLYRTGGVNSKVQRLMTSVFGKQRLALFSTIRLLKPITSCFICAPLASTAPADMQLDAEAWDNKTITSGLKNYFR